MALKTLVTYEPGVLQPLAQLSRLEARSSNAGAADASSARRPGARDRHSRRVLAILTGIAFGAFALRLLRRAADRERELTAALRAAERRCWRGCGRRRRCWAR